MLSLKVCRIENKLYYFVKRWSLIFKSFSRFGWFLRKKVGYVFSPSGIYLNHSLSLSFHLSFLFSFCFSSYFLLSPFVFYFIPLFRSLFLLLNLSYYFSVSLFLFLFFLFAVSLCLLLSFSLSVLRSVCLKPTVRQCSDIPIEKNQIERQKKRRKKNFPQVKCKAWNHL